MMNIIFYAVDAVMPSFSFIGALLVLSVILGRVFDDR